MEGKIKKKKKRVHVLIILRHEPTEGEICKWSIFEPNNEKAKSCFHRIDKQETDYSMNSKET